MNILIFSWRGLKHPNSGGAEIVTHQHAKYWVKNGHKVTIFTSKYEEAKTQEIIDGVTYYRSGHAVIGTHIRACWWYLYGNKENFDLVIDQFHGIPYFTPLYVRSKKLAFIHEVTKEIWFLNQLPKPFNYLVAVVGFYLEPLIFKIIYKNIEFLTVSNSTKNDLVNWGISKTKIHVVHNGVNIIKPYSLIKNSRPTITFLGALAKDKGIEDSIKVFEKLHRKYSEWQFWIIGEGDKKYKEYLKKVIFRDVGKGKVKFWGFVSEKDKFKLLAKSQILLNPSIREGWGLVNIEANSVGTPVVGYNTQGTKDSVKNNKTGFLVKLGDVQGLANRVEQLVLDKNLYQKVSQECLNWSKKFNWNQQAKKSLKLISEELN
ncbi:hypothetical protein A3C32_04420 [Candidatus Daviesbacteria bacterium RIFCSPHIGHO2_02_FULL_41_14]|uniref:Glycosyl transferase family 1 domain-containing protein n=1 Tax=Candidatus Daviesbacteria bacterium RIFCSPLOWO2_01_FULL_40_24 TaxID=1797787 RepID=A0A1F5MJC6_9BACT|nr:MAG: hypothetical protein A3C32_04420 [Candidatus Daviesbacteria bacterium RIFCSPHIGHO2_02_FULL_41_14]OGE65471.1 MAG: hypothetical protein A3B49_01115 [Candidatus Daviesbacteria bacterium RIFCSPLOWO2_01_FULL_40_24]